LGWQFDDGGSRRADVQGDDALFLAQPVDGGASEDKRRGATVREGSDEVGREAGVDDVAPISALRREDPRHEVRFGDEDLEGAAGVADGEQGSWVHSRDAGGADAGHAAGKGVDDVQLSGQGSASVEDDETAARGHGLHPAQTFGFEGEGKALLLEKHIARA